MKTLLLSIILCSILSATATFDTQASTDRKKKQRKEQTNTIPKKANTIIQTTTFKNQKEACKHIINMLLMDGIIPEKVDTTNSFYILTSPIETKTSHVKLSFIAIQQADSVLVLTSGQLNTNIEITLYGVTSTSTWTKINYSGMKGSPIRDAWEYMHEKTTRIPSRSTRYATK